MNKHFEKYLDKTLACGYNMRVILNLEEIMAVYSTEQKRMLSDILSENRENAYSIEELIGELRKRYGEDAPGQSTVYRLITHLVEEGKVKRFVKGNGRRFVYQIMDCHGCGRHLHLKCVGCGRLIHLDSAASTELVKKIESVSDFSVMETQTVLFGECADCKGVQKR